MKNIAEILKDCPQGTKLYSPIFGEVELDEVHSSIFVRHASNKALLAFYEDGKWHSNGECMLFPSKENRDWSTFQRSFKDGDVVFYNDTIAIFKEWGAETLFRTYVTKYLCCDSLIDINVPLFGKSVRKEVRFATEEEKEILFTAIKDNGYKWNAETKTLEKLIKPKFKVGDTIKNKKTGLTQKIVNIDDTSYGIYTGRLDINKQDNYELIPNKFDITTLKPFDKVLVRDGNKDKWNIDFFAYYRDSGDYQCMTFTKNQCIPYEGNQHLLGITNDCDEYYKTW